MVLSGFGPFIFVFLPMTASYTVITLNVTIYLFAFTGYYFISIDRFNIINGWPFCTIFTAFLFVAFFKHYVSVLPWAFSCPEARGGQWLGTSSQPDKFSLINLFGAQSVCQDVLPVQDSQLMAEADHRCQWYSSFLNAVIASVRTCFLVFRCKLSQCWDADDRSWK